MTVDSQPKLRILLRAIAGVLIILFLLFAPAGTFRWPEAWLSLFLYFFFVGGALLWLRRKSPDLLKERMSRNKDVKAWDKKILFVYTILLVLMLVAAGFDAVRFSWSRVPSALKVIGFSGYVPAMVLIFWAITRNPFLSEVVRIQTDRAHGVCDTGPYQCVRHPMYVGIIIFILSVPLSLGSFYALIPGSLIVFLFVLRTLLEDKTLLKELPGYREYAERVRFRLIPGIW
jgi:protein-S-isoprenylcysteine O-methyltransferase Ste14